MRKSSFGLVFFLLLVCVNLVQAKGGGEPPPPSPDFSLGAFYNGTPGIYDFGDKFVTLAEDFSKCPSNINNRNICVLKVPEGRCADGGSYYLTIYHYDPSIQRTAIYMDGGGACTSPALCAQFQSVYTTKTLLKGVNILLAVNPDTIGLAHPMFDGKTNAFSLGYCTGDIFTGNRLAKDPKVTMYFYGNKNVVESMKIVKQLTPNPKYFFVDGFSAGAEGAVFNAYVFKSNFPNSNIHIVANAFAPFQVPYVSASKLTQVLNYWGALKSIPNDLNIGADRVLDFNDVLSYNSSKLSTVKFSLLGSFYDMVYLPFVYLLGGDSVNSLRLSFLNSYNTIVKESSNLKMFISDTKNHGFDLYSDNPNPEFDVFYGDQIASEWLYDRENDYKVLNIPYEL